VLEIGCEREAVLLAFHWTGTASYYQMGWNPDGAIQSPGVILLAESIEQSIREGLSKYDFLRGDEEYKQKWTSQSVAQTTLVVGRRVPARAAMTAERLKNRFKHAFQQTLGAGRWESMKRGLGGWAP
jgi:CelD/BcsL family acetyltransferase involved in cellulose biosynthesis